MIYNIPMLFNRIFCYVCFTRVSADCSGVDCSRDVKAWMFGDVADVFRYSAALRLAQSTRKQRSDLVEQVILQLGLKDAADTLIGNDFRRGCSGGEKRRTSIGVQLLANPSVLFLGISFNDSANF